MKIEKELAINPSVYQKDYKWFENVISSKYKDFDPYSLSPEDRTKFIEGDTVTLLSEEEKQTILKKMWTKMTRSVYGVSYSTESLQIFRGDPQKLYNPENDKLLTIPRELYKNKYPWFKTLPPVPTSRRVLGFCPPRDYYMEVSEYQDGFSRLGYLLLKAEADRGYWRLGPKKIPELPRTEIKCKMN